MKHYVFVILFSIVAGCTQTAEKIENAANRSNTSWAMGKPYEKVASLGNSALDQLATEQYGFGQMIGQTTLTDGTTLYRHIAPASQTETSSDFAGLVGSSKQVTNYRLSYFKVGQDGIVQDWATGSALGSVSDCVTYISGIFQKCTDQSRIRQALAVYDSQVRTSSGATLGAWGPAVPTAQILQ